MIMKKILVLILLFLIMGIGGYAQEPIVKKVKIYGVSWNLRTNIPITIKDIKQRSDYCLILKDYTGLCIEEFAYDYKSCKELLMSQDTISYRRYRPSYRGKTCIACVKIYFGLRTITLYFRANGEYYFQGKYYKPNKELYYCIFSFFGKDAIMPDGLIQEGKIIYEENRRR